MILNGRMINPGELRTPVVLGKRMVTTGPGGFQAASFSAETGAWARWQNVHGAEVWQSAAQGVSQAATVLIRYWEGLDETWLVEKGGVVYEIVSVDDIQDRHEFMELKVKRWTEG